MAVSNEQKMLKERIRAVLGARRKTASDLGETDNEKKVYQRQILNDSNVTVETLTKILYMFHDVDANWLILGEGSMHKTVDRPQIFNQQRYEMQNGQNNNGTINFGGSIPYPVQALLDEKDKRIAELEKDKTQLQQYLSIFTRQAEANAPKKKWNLRRGKYRLQTPTYTYI